MRQNQLLRIAALTYVLLSPFNSSAHHSVNAFFDLSDPISVDGTLTSIRWFNPHVQLQIERAAPNGTTEIWTIDSGGPTLLRRLGVTADLVDLGDRVRISGFPSTRNENEMIGVAMQLADGRDMPMFPTLLSRFGLEQAGSGGHITADAAAESERKAQGIFRVWTSRQKPDRWVSEPEFTGAALAGRAAYDPLTDDLALQCIPSGMPIVMDNPFPIEFTETDDAILLRLEIFDVVRTIHMNAEAAQSTRSLSPLGYSIGRWEGNTLIIETTDINTPYFDDDGTPQSTEMEVVERFTLSDNDTRLDYEVVMTDPQTLMKPAARYGHWVWVPGEELQDYGCTLEDD